jgi:hypothetical protein
MPIRKRNTQIRKLKIFQLERPQENFMDLVFGLVELIDAKGIDVAQFIWM